MANADSERHASALLLRPAPARRRCARLGAIAILLGGGWMAAFAGCDDKALCPNQDDLNACTVDQCKDGIAVHTYLGDGYPCFLGRLQGACSAGSCIVPCSSPSDCDDGRPCTFAQSCTNGACVFEEEINDIPSDGNPCTNDGCLGGEPIYWPKPEATPCHGGKGECDSGICSTCTVAAHCGTDTLCREWECKSGTCVPDDTPKGIVLPDDLRGDCRQRVCNGHGGIHKIADPGDAPRSTDPCFAWTCAGWTPLREVLQGKPCTTSIGVLGVCNEDGICVQCLKDTDCPQWGDRCDDNTCVSCGDNTQNGGETGIDCGGPCGACLGEPCAADNDCASDQCIFTNTAPPKVCCDDPCDAECFRCATSGHCDFVPLGGMDETCNSPSVACNGSGHCKTKNGYMCTSSLDCISNHCNPITKLCSN